MTHVDDWLDNPANKAHPAYEFLSHARRPAVDMDRAWMKANRLTAMWRGERFLLVGASRMGDVWLKDENDGRPNAHYTHRVDIAELSEWMPA